MTDQPSGNSYDSLELYHRKIPVGKALYFTLDSVRQAFEAAGSVNGMLDLCSIERTAVGEVVLRWDYIMDGDIASLTFFPDGSLDAQVLDLVIPDWVELDGGVEEILDQLADRFGLEYL